MEDDLLRPDRYRARFARAGDGTERARWIPPEHYALRRLRGLGEGGQSREPRALWRTARAGSRALHQPGGLLQLDDLRDAVRAWRLALDARAPARQQPHDEPRRSALRRR